MPIQDAEALARMFVEYFAEQECDGQPTDPDVWENLAESERESFRNVFQKMLDTGDVVYAGLT